MQLNLLPSMSADKVSALTSQWRAGTVLQALVRSVESSTSATLQIGNRQLPITTPIPLRSGQTLTLEVISTQERLALRIVPQPVAKPVLATAVRADLPRQLPLPQLLQTVISLARQPQRLQQLPQPVQQAVQNLLQALPRSEGAPTPKLVAQAIQRSGIWLESQLAKASGQAKPAPDLSTNIRHDFKGRLLALIRTLQAVATQQSSPTTTRQTATQLNPSAPQQPQLSPPPSPPGVRGYQSAPALLPLPPAFANGRIAAQPVPAVQALLPEESEALQQLVRQQADGALARVQLNQVASTPREQTPAQQNWHVEIPLQLGDRTEVIQMRIDRDGQEGENEQAQPQFRVTLALDLGELGEVHATVNVRGDRVAVHFWASEDETRALFQREMGTLQAALESAGLECEAINCSTGESPPGPRWPTQSLLSEQA